MSNVVTFPAHIFDPEYAIKFVKEADDERGRIVEGMLHPFDSIDLDGEFFSAKTRFNFGEYQDGESILAVPNAPTYYDHTHNDNFGMTVMGHLIPEKTRKTSQGIIVQTELARSSNYRKLPLVQAALEEIIESKSLGYSSGTASHLIRYDDADRRAITNWPTIEASFTVIPSNPETLGVDFIKSAVDSARAAWLNGTKGSDAAAAALAPPSGESAAAAAARTRRARAIARAKYYQHRS